MDAASSNIGSISIEKLRDNNYHTWKARIQFILSLRDLDDVLEGAPPDNKSSDYSLWHRRDKKAKAVIALSLSDEHLEQVQHAATAKEIWKLISDIYEKHTLLNKLAARRAFYTAKMGENEKVRAFAARIRQYSSTLKSMKVDVKENEMAMALLWGLPDRFDGLISALDAIADNEETFTFEFVVGRVEQEERRHADRLKDALSKAETAALLASQQKGKLCARCGKHSKNRKCFWEHPEIAPDWHPVHKIAQKQQTETTKSQTQNQHALVGQTQSLGTNETSHEYVCLAAISAREPKGCPDWIIDSGSTCHLTDDNTVLTNYKRINSVPLDLGGGATSMIVGVGDMYLNVKAGASVNKCLIRDVKHVPNLGYRILSVSTTAKRGGNVSFSATSVSIISSHDGSFIADGSMIGGLYRLNVSPNFSTNRNVALTAQTLETWHQRLGHVSSQGIKHLANQGIVNGLELRSDSMIDKCSGCILGKSHRSIIPKTRTSRSTKHLELIHTDVLGPIEVASIGGSRYVITFIDDYSHWTAAYTMKSKSEALSRFKEFKAMAEKHTSTKVKMLKVFETKHTESETSDPLKLKALRSDNGGEYLSNEFKDFLLMHGIKHELTVAYTPQQNGVAERMNRTLLDLTRAMLHHRDVDKCFWAEAIATAVYIRNRVTSRSLPSTTTPYHLWHGKAPEIGHLRVFGCTCWYTIPKRKTKKLDRRAAEGIMVGYSKLSKGYKIWDIEQKKFVVSRDVQDLRKKQTRVCKTRSPSMSRKRKSN